MNELFAKFWRQNPSLLYGLSSLIGASFALKMIELPIVIILAIVMYFPLLIQKNHWISPCLAFALMICTGWLTHSYYLLPPSNLNSEKVGVAEIEISSISRTTTPFGKTWLYKANLFNFSIDGQLIARNIPIRITQPDSSRSDRPVTSYKYRIYGRLKILANGKYGFVPNNIKWEPIAHSYNFADWRFQAKSSLQRHIDESIGNRHVASVLGGIATGSFDDMQLSNELSRFGLQHLMAISGLHFSILASLLGIGLCLIFSSRITSILTIILLSAYFIFLGNSPSVMRAWITLSIGLFGILTSKRSQALNSLGFAILVIVLYDPLSISEIGFQFSFIITASILIWFSPLDHLMQKIFMKRPLSQMVTYDWIDQHAYCILCFLRQALALTLAVNLAALPLTLYYFQKFPLMSLIYNLFFPFTVSLSMLLLLLAVMTAPIIPILSTLFHNINDQYTQFLLNLAFNLPVDFDFNLYTEPFPGEFVLYYLLILFTLGIYQFSKDRRTMIEA